MTRHNPIYPPCTPSRPEATPGSKVVRWLRPETGEVTGIVCYQDAAEVASELARQLAGQVMGAYWVPVVRGAGAIGTE